MPQPKPLIARISPLIDLILAAFFIYQGSYLVNFLAPYFGWEEIGRQIIFQKLTFAPGFLVCSIPIILAAHGFYQSNNRQRHSKAIKQIFQSSSYFFTLSILCYFFIGNFPELRPLAIISLVIIPGFIYLRYLIFHILQLHIPISKHDKLEILIIGKRHDIEKNWKQIPPAWQSIIKNPYFAYSGESTLEEAQNILCNKNIQVAYILGGNALTAENKEFITICKKLGITIYIQLLGLRPLIHTEKIGSDHILILNYSPKNRCSYLIKELMDPIVAFILLLCSLPLWVVAAIGIKYNDPKGPIFYKQMRSGRFGKPFGMWKFRSMYINAEERLDEIKKEHGNEMDGPIFKLTSDPRIFKFGNFIRKTSIDELPQLLNIIKGDMSLVGPRPLPLYETDEFPNVSDRRRLSVKPGLTCYWQVEDRSSVETSFSIMVEKDLKYIDNWSLWLDVTLFLRTIPAVLLRRGAK